MALTQLTVPRLKERCRELGIRFTSKWKKVDFVSALYPTEFKQQWVPQATFSNKYIICNRCQLMQPFAVDNNDNALCVKCSVGVNHRVFTTQETNDLNAYYDIFWNKQVILLENTAGCVVSLKQSDWFSLDATLKKILEYRLPKIRYSYQYEFDLDFTVDYKDYKIVNKPDDLDFNQTLGELLYKRGVHFPSVPSLLDMTQNIVREHYDKGKLMKYKILPPKILRDL